MVQLKHTQLFFIPSYCVSMVMACAQSHPYEGYEPATTKEVAEAQEETQINSMDRISEQEVKQAAKNSKGASGTASSKTSQGAQGSQGAANMGPADNVDTGNVSPRAPSHTESQGVMGPSTPSVGAGSPSGGASGGAAPPAGP